MPAWAQVMRDLRHLIDQGDLSTGARLPTENELAERYGVSRITVRQALARLAADGYVDRRQGTGTFVSDRVAPVQHDLSLTTSWRVRLEAAGHTTGSRLLASGLADAVAGRVASVLPEPVIVDIAGRPLAHLQRVQSVDGHPIGLSESWVPVDLAPGLESAPLDDGSLSRTFSVRYGIDSARTENLIEAGLATSVEADLLETYVDVPLFVVTAVNYLANGRVMEVSRTAWLGSRVRFRSVREERDHSSEARPSSVSPASG